MSIFRVVVNALQKYSAGAAHTYEQGADAGERQPGSTSGADHKCVAGEWKTKTLTVAATGDLTVYPGPCVVRSVRVRATTDVGVATANTAGIILIKDGATVKDGAAAAKTPGATIYDGLDGAIFASSLIVNFASTSDSGKVEVAFRPLDPNVTWMNV